MTPGCGLSECKFSCIGRAMTLHLVTNASERKTYKLVLRSHKIPCVTRKSHAWASKNCVIEHNSRMIQ